MVQKERGPDWPPSEDASPLDVLLAALARLDSIGVTPWNASVDERRVILTLLAEPDDEVDHVLEPLVVNTRWGAVPRTPTS
jgi:hypothetical protein